MIVRELRKGDESAYAEFRRGLWPSNAAAGNWEAVELKYTLNPLRTCSPGSGLYGSFDGDRLCGILGAYALPITTGDQEYPGHMLVDWAVLPEYRSRPIGSILWRELVRLPGMKFASIGTRVSQEAISKAAEKIPAIHAIGLVDAAKVVLTKCLGLFSYGHPSPVIPEDLVCREEIEIIDVESIRPAVPASPDQVAWVRRGVDFWKMYCGARIYTAAMPLRIRSSEGEADLVIALTQAGKTIRYAAIMSASFFPYTVACGEAVGRLLRAFLVKNRVAIVTASETDEIVAALMKRASLHVLRNPTYWWSVRKPTNPFRHDEKKWWLTAADRDSHFGGIQPCRWEE